MGHGFDVLALRLDPRLLRLRQARNASKMIPAVLPVSSSSAKAISFKTPCLS
jgi:hypothetical protein